MPPPFLRKRRKPCHDAFDDAYDRVCDLYDESFYIKYLYNKIIAHAYKVK